MYYIVDRIEEEYVVLEKDNTMINIKKEEVGFNVKEGDVLKKDKEGKFALDKEATKNIKEEIEEIVANIWEN